MTLTELDKELEKITYGEGTDGISRLASIVNMSLERLYSDLKPISSYSFYKKEILPMKRPISFHKEGGTSITLPLAGRAYGMHVSGNGAFTVSVKGREDKTTRFYTRGEFFSGMIQGDGSITFSGDYSYDVYSLSFYDEIASKDIADIPSGRPKRYDLLSLISDFMYPAELPKDENGCEIDGAEYIGDELYLPTDYEGRVVIKYYVMPTSVNALQPDKEIGVDKKYLMPLLHLCAYYTLLDGEGELAERHMQSYLALVRERNLTRNYTPSLEYIIKDKWA